jgi:4-carboxymuconolactone decarboxylase
MKTRSLVTLGILTALGGTANEVRAHAKGAMNLGVTKEELVELFIHAAAYCGVPRTGEAFRAAQEALAEDEG